MFLVLAAVVLVVVMGLMGFRHTRSRNVDCGWVPCDRTEDKAFFVNLDPEDLPLYQESLDELFLLLDASHFSGARVPDLLNAAVEQVIAEMAVSMKGNSKYLRVMLNQFLLADVAVRRQKEVWSHWAEQVYELDCKGCSQGPPGIPSAWKVNFYDSMRES
jgi:hypothetical protein